MIPHTLICRIDNCWHKIYNKLWMLITNNNSIFVESYLIMIIKKRHNLNNKLLNKKQIQNNMIYQSLIKLSLQNSIFPYHHSIKTITT